IAGLIADDHTLLYISYIGGPTALACHEDLAGATGGDAVPDEEAEDIAAFIIDQAEEVPYTVDLQVSPGCAIGFSFSPAPPYGPFTGPSHPTFVETITAPTLVGSYTCTVTAVMTPGGPTTAVQTVNVTVTPGPPATLDLTPPSATNTVDEEHCVTATVEDTFGNPTPGVAVNFSVSGTNPRVGAGVTDMNGEAEFCYFGVFAGDDTITATAVGGTNPSDTATKRWVLPTSTAGCKVTQGGRITTVAGNKANFGGNAHVPPKGHQNYRDHGTGMHVSSLDVDAVVCRADGTATIFGTADVDGTEMAYRIDVRDAGEPGTADRYRIRLINGYDSGDRQLDGGNVQIH
ncbi:MAG TPA: Ig-like domain-containing protein, partial [Gaiellaceae bacterium]|nr:Ig-like domain-containing protein [Gaiellaceae bacterium]